MNSEELRSALSSSAEQAGPHGVSSLEIVKKSRQQRKRRTVVALGSTVAVLALGALVGTTLTDSHQDGELAKAPEEPLIVCGQKFSSQGKDSTPGGVSIRFSSVKKVDDKSGPETKLAVSSDQKRTLTSTPPESIRVVYLKDGIVIGGGPALNEPGDLAPQPEFLVGHNIEAGPGKPSIQKLGKRDTLCSHSGVGWPQIWKEAAVYEIAVLLFPPAEVGPKVPDLGSGYLVIRRKLAP